jgi:hypothetical protein
MRYVFVGLNLPGFNLQPVAVFLINDLVVQVQ